MDVKQRQETLIAYGEKKKGAEVYYRKSWECYYFSLLGKCFGMMNDKLITVKGKPETNELLRSMYTDVIPGYYANKTHWNSIYLHTEQVSEAELFKFLDQSYELVYQKLRKKEQQQIQESAE